MPQTFNDNALRNFSASLLALSRVVREAGPEQLLHEALLVLRPLVPFRSAWWGECSDAGAGSPPRNWLHGRIGLSPAFAQEWNRLAQGDVFARESMQNLGMVVRAVGHEDPVPEVAAFSRRHGLYHVMALTVELPGSGLMFFVSLYRDEASPAFDDGESVLFSEFSTHLLQHWRSRVQGLLLGAAPQSSDAFALADAHGNLLYLGGRLAAVIHQACPGWDGSTLPTELTAALARAPCAMVLGGHELTLQPCGELVALALDRGNRRARLPPRERSVAMLYAQGHSYKVIARLLGLSPATVRTYLRSAYLQLGVRNKIELGSALLAESRTRS
ncbi:MAG: helix-turn-helix transcriptional regulator [Burkholderiales bacterium]